MQEKKQEVSTRVKYILQAIVIILGGVVILGGVSLYAHYYKEDLLKKGKTSIAEVKTSGIRVKVEFKANGQLYTSKILDRPYEGIRSGEKFEVLYKQNNPSKFMMLYHKPVLNEEEFATTASTYIHYGHSSITFEYEIRDTIYHRVQDTGWERLSDKYRKANAKYLVKYKKDNPIIGYLYLDSLLHN